MPDTRRRRRNAILPPKPGSKEAEQQEAERRQWKRKLKQQRQKELEEQEVALTGRNLSGQRSVDELDKTQVGVGMCGLGVRHGCVACM
jgi:hypothetical protein